jgi:imidazolonepropionase-like amidohydrolase
MRLRRIDALIGCLALFAPTGLMAQRSDALDDAVQPFVRVAAHKVVLAHVQLIDGTGSAASADRNVYLTDGKITAISKGADGLPADGTTVLDLHGYSVMPGIVGMHNHLYYLALPRLAADYSFDHPALFVQMSYSAPRLYLANGITTMRTTGSIEPETDLRLKQAIELGLSPGPHLDVTGPYLDGPGSAIPQIQQLNGPKDARETVAYWADRGVTSFKAYAHITRAELRAVVEEAHKRGLKVAGHLCSITYAEAAEIGIDSLEHGFFANTENDPGKTADTCSESGGNYTLDHMNPDGAEAKRLIGLLVSHHVAITSTLPNTAASALGGGALPDGQPWAQPGALEAMSPAARDFYLYWRNRPGANRDAVALRLRRDMELERAFVAAGGLLLAGADPNGVNGLVPGFADHREIELLVEAGFSAPEAIRIATLNGAIFLGLQDRIGSIAVGKNADLMVIKGDPGARIADIENVEIVFKDGIGYDTKKLLAAAKGHYGEY